MARLGGVFCRKSELKKFPDPNCAGGCGVVPFSWARCLFRGVSAALAARCCGDRIYSRGDCRWAGKRLRMAHRRPDYENEKARAGRAGVY